MFKVNSIWCWILISMCCGLVAGLLTALFSRHVKKNADGMAEEENDLDEIEGSRSSNILFVVLVFSLLAFLIVWL